MSSIYKLKYLIIKVKKLFIILKGKFMFTSSTSSILHNKVYIFLLFSVIKDLFLVFSLCMFVVLFFKLLISLFVLFINTTKFNINLFNSSI